jgi:hypothetical protein
MSGLMTADYPVQEDPSYYAFRPRASLIRW